MKNDDVVESLFELARMSSIQGDNKTAENALGKLSKLLPKGRYVKAKLAIAKYTNGKKKSGWTLAKDLIKENPNEPHGYYAVGCIHFLNGSYEKSIESLEQAHRIAGEDTIQLDIIPLLAELKREPVLLANLYSRMKLRKDLDENERLVLETLPNRYKLLCIKTSKFASYEDAVELLESLAPQQRDANFYIVRANLHLRDGERAEAEKDFSRAISMLKSEGNIDLLYQALVDRAFLYLSYGELESALTDYTDAIVLNPQRYLAYKMRGTIKRTMNRSADALADFELAFEKGQASKEWSSFLEADLTLSMTNCVIDAIGVGEEGTSTEVLAILRDSAAQLEELSKAAPHDPRIKAWLLFLKARMAKDSELPKILTRIRQLYKRFPGEQIVIGCYSAIGSMGHIDPDETEMLATRIKQAIPALDHDYASSTFLTSTESPKSPPYRLESTGPPAIANEPAVNYPKKLWQGKKRELAQEIQDNYMKDSSKYHSKRQAFKILFQNYIFPEDEYYKGFTWEKCYDLTMER